MKIESLKQKKLVFIISFSIFILITLFCRHPQPRVKNVPAVDPHQPHNFIAHQGMVVAAHPLAVQAGLEMLKKGGNAVDAAVATASALNACEPFASGIGGGGFMVIYIARLKKITVINFREKAPDLASPRMFISEGKIKKEWARTHGLAVAVPGALAGWAYALSKYGSKSLSSVLAKAIEIAEKGFKVSKTFSNINKDQYEKLLLNAGEESCYLNEGLPYEPGDIFGNPALARTLKIIASKGISEFYQGKIAQKIVEAVRKKGGLMTLKDLALYRPLEQKPLKASYKDYTLYTIPPPGSGGLHIIQLLKIGAQWPLKQWGPSSFLYIHHLSEALRLIFADRNRYLGDPKFVSIPLKELISDSYAAQVASLIKPDRLLESYPYSQFNPSQNNKESTTHLCVIDRKGNIVSLTQSINHFFGSGIVPQDTGFLLNNHMDDFSKEPDSANAPGPGKQPLSSMGPLIMFYHQNPFLVLGSPGGTRIFSSLTEIILNIVEFGMSLDEAIEAPRFFTYSSQGKAGNLYVESRLSSSVIKALEKVGHKIIIRKAYDKYFGGAQGIMIPPGKKVIYGGADSRRDGYGAGY